MAPEFVPTGSRLLTFRVGNIESDEAFESFVDEVTDALHSDPGTAALGPAVGGSADCRAIEVIYTPVAMNRAACAAAKEQIHMALGDVLRVCEDVETVVPSRPLVA